MGTISTLFRDYDQAIVASFGLVCSYCNSRAIMTHLNKTRMAGLLFVVNNGYLAIKIRSLQGSGWLWQ